MTAITMQVGDVGEVRLREGRTSERVPVEVVKVGRKWAEVQEAEHHRTRRRIWRIEMASGSIDGRGYTSPGRFLTPAQSAHADRMTEARAVIREAGFETRIGCQPPDALLIAVAETIRASQTQEPRP